MIAQQIEAVLQSTFVPAYLELVNESHQHNVPAKSETHFKLTLASAEFDGLNRVRRHQRVYGALQTFLDGPVHALALHLFTPDEWQAQTRGVPSSPKCRGGE